MNEAEQLAALEQVFASDRFWNSEAESLALPAVTLQVTEHSGRYEWKVTWCDRSEWLSSQSHGPLRSQEAAKEDMRHCLRDRLVSLRTG
jgi:hypothetical protein